MRAADDLVSAIGRGESRSLVLRGEAGIGKTALLEYLIASAPDVTVVRAVGVQSDMELAFASLHQLCGPLLDRLEGLPAPQRQAMEIVFGLTAGEAPDRLLVGLAVLSLFSEVAEQRPLSSRSCSPKTSADVPIAALKMTLFERVHMPSFAGATEWLNSEPLGTAELRGHVVLVNFWTWTCINWLRQEPYVRAWSHGYRRRRADRHRRALARIRVRARHRHGSNSAPAGERECSRPA